MLCTEKICKLPRLYILLNHLPCNDQNVKKQMSLGKQKNSQQKPHHVSASLTHTHSCREKDGILTGPGWLGTQFQNFGGAKKKEKEKKICVKLTEKLPRTHPKQKAN